MLFLRNTFIVLLLLTLAAISVVGVMIEAPQVFNYTPDRINALGRSVLAVMRPGHLLFITWWIILLGLLLVVLFTISRNRRKIKIEVQMGGGRVVIMDAAIKKYIRNALSEIGEVTVKKIELREHRNLVTTDITADVRTRENLPTLERRIISRVRTALAEDLGITNLGDVHVFIRNFEVTGRPISPDPEPVKKTNHKAVPVTEELIIPRETLVEQETAFQSEAEPETSPLITPLAEDNVVFTDSGLMTTEPAETVNENVSTFSATDTDNPSSYVTDSPSYPVKDLDEPMPWLKSDAVDVDPVDSNKDKDTYGS